MDGSSMVIIFTRASAGAVQLKELLSVLLFTILFIPIAIVLNFLLAALITTACEEWDANISIIKSIHSFNGERIAQSN